MRSIALFGFGWLTMACGGAAMTPAKTPETGSAPQEQSTATVTTTKAAGLGPAPAGLAPAAAECQSYVGAAGSCAPGELNELLAAALGATGTERDAKLRCLENAKDAPPGLLHALRADLAPRGCADLVVGEDAQAPGAAREI